MVKILRRKDTPLFLALLVAVGAAVAGITWAGWLERPEILYYDFWHQLAGVRYQPQHVVIVALDEPTLKAHPTEPLVCWTPNFARVIQVLRRVGARVIGLDYLFQISIESWLKTLDLPANHRSLNYDGPFKQQLASGQVVMAGYLDHQQKSIIPPIPSYLSALSRPQQEMGLINLFNDNDGAIRRFVPALADDHGQINLTFGKLLALRAAGGDPVGELERWQQEPALRSWSAEDAEAVDLKALPLVGFVGPPDTFRRISMQRFLSPGAEQDQTITSLKDKIIITVPFPVHFVQLRLQLGQMRRQLSDPFCEHVGHMQCGLILESGEQHIPGPALDQRHDRRAAAGSDQQIALPVPWHTPLIDLRRPLRDRDHLADLTAGLDPPTRATGATPSPELLAQLPTQLAARLHIQRAIDRFVTDPHLLIIGMIVLESGRDLLRRPEPLKPLLDHG